MVLKKQNQKRQSSDNSEYVASLSSNSIQAEPHNLTERESLDQEAGKGRKMGRKNQGNWKKDEEARFMEHMLKHDEIYRDKDLRRTHKIFKKMGKFVRTRSSEQCRSHHQKLELKLKSYDAIISYIQEKIKDPVLEEESDDGIHYSPIRIENYLPFAYLQKIPQLLEGTKKNPKKENPEEKAKEQRQAKQMEIKKEYFHQTDIGKPVKKQQHNEEESNKPNEIKVELGYDFFLMDEEMEQV